MKNQTQYKQLIKEGFCTFDQILPLSFIERLSAVTTRLAKAQNREEPGRFRSQGSMVRTPADPIFAELIAWQPSLDALHEMGFKHPTFTDGYVISKPPHSPPLFWHYDWFAWEDPASYRPEPLQVFFMYYLSDTNRENGCLRVIPGSHIQHNDLHDVIDEPHSAKLGEAENFDNPAFSTCPDEIDVPINAGDLLIGDARLLHATHANQTDQRRTVITLWFQPGFNTMPDRIKAQMVQKTQPVPDWWPTEARNRVEALHPQYHGDAEPYGRTLYRRRGTEISYPQGRP